MTQVNNNSNQDVDPNRALDQGINNDNINTIFIDNPEDKQKKKLLTEDYSKLRLDMTLISNVDCTFTPRERTESTSSAFFSVFRQGSFTSNFAEASLFNDKSLTPRVEENKLKQIVEQSITFKKEAAIYVKKGKYQEAAENYKKAIDLLNVDQSYFPIINQSNFMLNKLECMTNVAFCFYKLKNYDQTVLIADEVLKEQNNVRALYFRAKALKNMGRYNEACLDIKKALTIKSNQSLIKELNELQEKTTLVIPSRKNTEDGLSSNSQQVELVEKGKSKFDNTNLQHIINEEPKPNPCENSSKFIQLIKIIWARIVAFLKRHRYATVLVMISLLIIIKNKLRLKSTEFSKVFSFYK